LMAQQLKRKLLLNLTPHLETATKNGRPFGKQGRPLK
jgi:hypothetical protein